VRIALVSPYSWTYPGGVTRHIEALAQELSAHGHEPRILTPYDPDDARARRLHRGARPQARELPEHVVALGGTVGLPANGAVSNVAMTPSAVLALRAELRKGGYDVVHIHEPIAPPLCWDALLVAKQPLVGTFHAYSESLLMNRGANFMGAFRRLNRLHVRIAVSPAAEWTAKRFFGGRYTIVPNGVDLQVPDRDAHGIPETDTGPLRILFVGQAVERKGLPVALRAFEALREHVPATLTLVGADPAEVAPMLLDDRGVLTLGKVSEDEKQRQLARADVLCAPSLAGESFGMVLTEAFAARTPVVASDIPGYRDVVRDGRDGLLVPAGDAVALAEALRGLALDRERRARMAASARERAERFAWPRVAGEVMDCYERAIAVGPAPTRIGRLAVSHGLAPADLLPRVAPEPRLPSLRPAPPLSSAKRALATLRRVALMSLSLLVLLAALFVLGRIGLDRVLTSLLASRPGLVGGALGLMCASMFARALAWHAILRVAPACRAVTFRMAMRATFIGVLMSATLPARLGEPARALVLARRLGRTRETLPAVLGTMVSQTLLNLLALCGLGAAMFASSQVFAGHAPLLVAAALAPLVVVWSSLLGPTLATAGADSRSVRLRRILRGLRVWVVGALRFYRHPLEAGAATAAQLGAWALQWLSCWLLLMALGLDGQVGAAGAAAVLFAVNVTAVVPATPANVGLFQAACVAVLSGVYRVPVADAIAYGLILQAIEIATAVAAGMPALWKEGMSWRELRLRALHTAPVELAPTPAVGGPRGRAVGSTLEG
jgi:phosphatidyl-myo-inositol alpha-mannosyltransferase